VIGRLGKTRVIVGDVQDLAGPYQIWTLLLIVRKLILNDSNLEEHNTDNSRRDTDALVKRFQELSSASGGCRRNTEG